MEILNNIKGNEIFKSLFEHSVVGMSITSIDGILTANAAYCQMLGYTVEELRGRKWADFTHPDDIEKNHAIIADILNSDKKSARWEKRYLHKNGSVVWVDIHTFLLRDDKGAPIHFITTINDITFRRHFEVVLKESEQRFSTLIRQMNEGIAIIDTQGIFRFANPAAEQILEYEKDTLTGSDIRNILGDMLFDLNLSLQAEHSCLNQETFEYELVLKDGSIKNLLGSASPRFKEDVLVEIFILFRDITLQKKVADQLKSQNTKLQQSNAEKDKFFAILAHDLRGPLSTFLGLAEVMAEDINTMTIPEIEDISKSLHQSASSLFQLLENLLEWSILKRGDFDYSPEKQSLNRILLRSIDPVSESARSKNVTIKFDLTKTYYVNCDSKMTETIFRNIISNALKYSHPGGSIVISAEPVANGELIVSVQDYGIGMNSNILEKLFIMNEQVSRRGTDGESSSGLGLLICKEFIEKQSGRIWAESEEGEGSTFHFTLKLADNE
jgi:PAS domain S-box-containing protein